MNKKNAKFVKKNKYAILVVAIGLALLVTTITVAKADVSFWDKVAQWTGMGIADKIDVPDSFTETEEVSLGAFPGTDIYEKMYFHDGVRATSDINIPLYLTATSSTVSDPIMGEYCHKDINPIEITNWHFRISNDNQNYGFPINIGTTSCLAYSDRRCVDYSSIGGSNGTSTGTLLDDAASRLEASQICTSTAGVFTRDAIMDYLYRDIETGITTQQATLTPGTFYTGSWTQIAYMGLGATSTPFVLVANDCIVINDTNVGGATSSDSHNTGDGDFEAYFYADTRIITATTTVSN